jgi:penicillin amidase
MRWIGKIAQSIFIGALILAILVMSSGYFYLRRSLPEIDGTVKVAGLTAPVEIIRDRQAVPHIYAENKLDAMFGLGYVHAQDRLWQMEFQRRIAYGRLSEIVGPASVPADRFLRTLGVKAAATSAWDALSPPAREQVDAYVAGINAFVSSHSGSQLPPEFMIMGVSPEPWNHLDVLAWVKMMAWNMSTSHTMDLLRDDIARALGPERAAAFMAGYPDDGPSTVELQPEGQGFRRLVVLEEQIRAQLNLSSPYGGGIGSNAWVVDGTLSATGKPLLANDTHMGTALPSIWYLAHLSAGDFDVIGATVPGLPAVLVGRNRSIAWGITNLNPDVQDLFRERLDPSGRQVEFKGQMEPIQIVTETIKVSGSPDVPYPVRYTRHGPLLSDVLNINNQELPADQRTPELEPLALKWSALEPGDRTVEAVLNLNQASTWQEFSRALQDFAAPAMNFVYADVAGNIGYYGAGRIPIRAAGDGSLPVEGWSGDYEWTGWVPFDELPQSYNPPEHFIVSANNRPISADYPHYLGRDWAAPYRAQRITELLQAGEKFSAEDFNAMQGDLVSLQARQLLPMLLQLVTPADDQQRRAVELLQAWDGRAAGDSAAAAIYEVWLTRLPRAIVGDELDARLINRHDDTWFLAETLKQRASPWCDDTRTAEPEDCAALAQQTLAGTLVELTERLGADMTAWRWDKLHTVMFPHATFGQVPVVGSIFSRSAPFGGDGNTINIGSVEYQELYKQYVAAAYRQVIDLSSPDGGQFILTIGQSGHVFSPHYDDYLYDWVAVRNRPMQVERATIEGDATSTLRLEP